MSPQKEKGRIIIFGHVRVFIKKSTPVVVELLSGTLACDDFTRDDDDDDDDAIIVGTLEQQDHPQDEEKERRPRGRDKAWRALSSRAEKKRKNCRWPRHRRRREKSSSLWK